LLTNRHTLLLASPCQAGGRHNHYVPGHDLPLEEEEDEEFLHEMAGDLEIQEDQGTENLATEDAEGLSSAAADSLDGTTTAGGGASAAAGGDDEEEAGTSGAVGAHPGASASEGAAASGPPFKRRHTKAGEVAISRRAAGAAAADGGDVAANGNAAAAALDAPRRSGRQRASCGGGEDEADGVAGGNGDGAAPRRSGRAVKPRVVYVDGLPVLKNNLYGMEGEPSVFDRELKGQPPAAAGCPRQPAPCACVAARV
jgi:hypothetical protein